MARTTPAQKPRGWASITLIGKIPPNRHTTAPSPMGGRRADRANVSQILWSCCHDNQVRKLSLLWWWNFGQAPRNRGLGENFPDSDGKTAIVTRNTLPRKSIGINPSWGSRRRRCRDKPGPGAGLWLE